MLQLDDLSSFAICGAGASVGAAMLRPSLSHDPAGAEALRICRSACAVVGIGLVQPVALDAPLPLWSQATMVFGAVGGVVMIGWALAALAAQVLQAQLRVDARLARLGGVEFVAVVPVPDLPVARRMAERMRQRLEEASWPDVLPGRAKVTARLGVTLLAGDESLERAVARADEALYHA